MYWVLRSFGLSQTTILRLWLVLSVTLFGGSALMSAITNDTNTTIQQQTIKEVGK